MATLPYFVDHVVPCTACYERSLLGGNENCYIVAQGDGVLKMLDCRTRTKTAVLWTMDSPKRKSIGALMIDTEKENEIVFSYKSPCTLNIVDMRNTHYSAITGKKSPQLLSSVVLLPSSSSFPLSLHPFFSTVVLLIISSYLG